MNYEKETTMNYDFENMPLTTGCARALIQALFAGEGYHKRAKILDTLTRHHNANGGTDTPKDTRVSAVKKALNDLETEGIAERHPDSPGYWRIRKTAKKG